jgi:anti-sigma-K factor RskA
VDIKKYIESGILENYVLGLTSEKENQEVQQLALQYPEIRKELDEIERSLERYAEARKIKAPIGLEAKILEKIDNAANQTPKDTPEKGSNNGLSFLLGFLFLVAAVAAFWFYNNSRTLKVANDDLQTQLDSLREDCLQTERDLQLLKDEWEIIRADGNETIIMKGTDKAPLAIATIHWNNETKKSYLDVIRLPAPPTDKQYQLWAIVDGVPTDMGVFDVKIDSTILQEVPFIENVSAFAVTLERKGGSPTPTLEEMVVIGNI